MACCGGGILENDEAADFVAEIKRKRSSGKLKAMREAFKDCSDTPSWPMLNYVHPENAAVIRKDMPSFRLFRVPRSWIGGPYLKDLSIPEDEEMVDAYVTEGEVLFFRCAAAALILADNLTDLPNTPKDLQLGELSFLQRQRLASDAKAALDRITGSSAVRTWFAECASLELYSEWLSHVSVLAARLGQVVSGAT